MLTTLELRLCRSLRLRRYLSRKSDRIGAEEEIPDHLIPFAAGRGRQERIDSISLKILEERKLHAQQCTETFVSNKAVLELESQGFGQKQRLGEAINSLSGTDISGTRIATATSPPWPIFDHLLPEIAFAGHSNTGKSSLVNVLVGGLPRSGPASVSERAGWTNSVQFYKLGRKPPILTLVDLPGYGLAVSSTVDRRNWAAMVDGYLNDRKILARCMLLVDCSRGLVAPDKRFLRRLGALKVQWDLLLTKGDLLSATELAQSVELVRKDALPLCRGQEGFQVLPVSASTGAGLAQLSRHLFTISRATSIDNPNSGLTLHLFYHDLLVYYECRLVVREHKAATEQRKATWIVSKPHIASKKVLRAIK